MTSDTHPDKNSQSRRHFFIGTGGIALTSLATFFAARASSLTNKPKSVFESYINAVKDGNMEKIRELRSSPVNLQNMRAWTEEYQEHDFEIAAMETIHQNENRAIIRYSLSIDDANRDSIKGQTTLIKHSGEWRVENVQ